MDWWRKSRPKQKKSQREICLQRQSEEKKDVDQWGFDGLNDHHVDKAAQWQRCETHTTSKEFKIVGGILYQR